MASHLLIILSVCSSLEGYDSVNFSYTLAAEARGNVRHLFSEFPIPTFGHQVFFKLTGIPQHCRIPPLFWLAGRWGYTLILTCPSFYVRPETIFFLDEH